MLKVVVWTILLVIVAIPAYFTWRELSEGHVLKVLIISTIVGFGGWLAYRRNTVRS